VSARAAAALAAALAPLLLVCAGAVAAASPEEPAPHTDAIPAGPSVAARLAEIQRRVQAALRYPPIARARGLSGEALVEFRITPDGAPVDVRTARSSGHPSLDRAALRAVAEAAPLPRMVGRVKVPVRFALAER
jgi:protein TonB